MNIIFFDGSCGMCHWVIRWVAKRDKRRFFYFAPLDGETAKERLKELSLPDSIVLLLEDDKRLTESRAVFEIAWQLGGIWSCLGLFAFLPDWALFPFDAIYRLVASHRDRSCDLGQIRQNNQYLDRFLP